MSETAGPQTPNKSSPRAITRQPRPMLAWKRTAYGRAYAGCGRCWRCWSLARWWWIWGVGRAPGRCRNCPGAPSRGVDISEAQIELARQNVPAGRFIHGDVSAVTFLPSSLDAVVSFYTLEHLPREEHALLLRRIEGWLRGGGYLLLGTDAADRPGGVDEWLGVPMYFSAFDQETLLGLVQEAGLEIVETAVETQREGGSEIPYLWLLARKPPNQ